MLSSLSLLALGLTLAAAMPNNKNPSDTKLISIADEALDEVQVKFTKNSTWNFVRKDEVSGVATYTMNYTDKAGVEHPGYAAVYETKVKPQQVFETLMYNIREQLVYNSLFVKYAEVNKPRKNVTLGLFEVTSDTPLELPNEESLVVMTGGLRRFGKGVVYMIGYQSVDYVNDKAPASETRTKASPSGYILEPTPNKGTRVTWLQNIEYNFKGPEAVRELYTTFNIILWCDNVKKGMEAKYIKE